MNENTDNKFEYKIGIIGPSRVGKTTLISTILNEGYKIFASTKISLNPVDNKTKQRLKKHDDDIRGSINAGEFNPGSLKGTQEAFYFEIEIDSGVPGIGIKFKMLDFPGGWLEIDKSQGLDSQQKEIWGDCKKFIEESNILIIPVDASPIMEAINTKQKKSLNALLKIWEVEAVTRQWAKNRNTKKDEPALLMICPLKCESYFSDNCGKANPNHPEELYGNVIKIYDNLIGLVKDEIKDAKYEIHYSPMDTIGCVKIVDSNWSIAEGKEPEFDPKFDVIKPGKIQTKGADNIIVGICHTLGAIRKKAEEIKERLKKEEAKNAKTNIEDRNIFQRFYHWITGYEKILNDNYAEALNEKIEAKKNLDKFNEVLDELAQRKYGSRDKIIK